MLRSLGTQHEAGRRVLNLRSDRPPRSDGISHAAGDRFVRAVVPLDERPIRKRDSLLRLPNFRALGVDEKGEARRQIHVHLREGVTRLRQRRRGNLGLWTTMASVPRAPTSNDRWLKNPANEAPAVPVKLLRSV